MVAAMEVLMQLGMAERCMLSTAAGIAVAVGMTAASAMADFTAISRISIIAASSMAATMGPTIPITIITAAG